MEKTFRELHQPGAPFILANAWDKGSAQLMSALGAKAIASTSAGHAFTLGRPDMGYVTRDEAIEHGRELVDATPLPVNGDLENGYGHDLEDIKATIASAFDVGMAGCGIEDTKLPDVTPYEFADSVERIEAAVDATRSLPGDFVLTARADGYMNRQYDFDEALRRAKAYESAGADVIYVPLLRNIDQVSQVCREINVPVNVLCAGKLINCSVADFAGAGVARISLGSMLSRITHQVILDSSREMFHQGTFASLGGAANGSEIDGLLEKGAKNI